MLLNICIYLNKFISNFNHIFVHLIHFTFYFNFKINKYYNLVKKCL